MFNCPRLESERDGVQPPGESLAAKKLGLRFVEYHRKANGVSNEVDEELAAALNEVGKKAASDGQTQVHVGTDGGSANLERIQLASWGVALAEPLPEPPTDCDSSEDDDIPCRTTTNIHGVKRPVGLLTSACNQRWQKRRRKELEQTRIREKHEKQDLPDAIMFEKGGEVLSYGQTAWDAEICAMMHALRAARKAATDMHIVIDNASVLNNLQLVLEGTMVYPPKNGFGIWARTKALCQGRQHTCQWCPSHGKREDWTPNDSKRSAAGYRRLNDAADIQATKALVALKTNAKPYLAECRAADRWTQNVLGLAISGSRVWDERMEQQCAGGPGVPHGDDASDDGPGVPDDQCGDPAGMDIDTDEPDAPWEPPEFC